MYLSAITKDEEKKLFLMLANFVAISHKEDEKADETGDSSAAVGAFVGLFDKPFVDLDGWEPSTKEKTILGHYGYELGVLGKKNWTGSAFDLGNYEVERVIQELEPTLKEDDALGKVARRKAIMDKLVDSLVVWEDFSNMTPKIRKIMMLELLALALVDNDYAELERYTIGRIAKKLSVDAEELLEMEEFIAAYMKVVTEGFDIING